MKVVLAHAVYWSILNFHSSLCLAEFSRRIQPVIYFLSCVVIPWEQGRNILGSRTIFVHDIKHDLEPIDCSKGR